MRSEPPYADEPEEERRGELTACGRCGLTVRIDVRVCPRCGGRIANTRWIPLAIGGVGLLAIAFVVLLMLKSAQDWDLEHRTEPVPAEQQMEKRPLGN